MNERLRTRVLGDCDEGCCGTDHERRERPRFTPVKLVMAVAIRRLTSSAENQSLSSLRLQKRLPSTTAARSPARASHAAREQHTRRSAAMLRNTPDWHAPCSLRRSMRVACGVHRRRFQQPSGGTRNARHHSFYGTAVRVVRLRALCASPRCVRSAEPARIPRRKFRSQSANRRSDTRAAAASLRRGSGYAALLEPNCGQREWARPYAAATR